jgi:hypothetical protein
VSILTIQPKRKREAAKIREGSQRNLGESLRFFASLRFYLNVVAWLCRAE